MKSSFSSSLAQSTLCSSLVVMNVLNLLMLQNSRKSASALTCLLEGVIWQILKVIGRKQRVTGQIIAVTVICFCSPTATAQGSQLYIDTLNHQMWIYTGNDRDYVYECSDNCNTVIINVNEGYTSKHKLRSQMVKNDFAKNLLERYEYLFKYKGFSRIIIKVYGIEPISYNLK